jgi:hypothetical protein
MNLRGKEITNEYAIEEDGRFSAQKWVFWKA